MSYENCPDCDGPSAIPFGSNDGKCSECHGTGLETKSEYMNILGGNSDCRNCGGSGKCPTCNGKGYV
jgi:DnaJ-class molecular chaperone